MKVLCAGHVTRDLYPHGIEAGGSVVYATKVHAALGDEVLVESVAGADFPGFDPPPGTEVHLAPARATTTFSNLHDRSGRRTQLVGAVAPEVQPPREVPVDLDVLNLCPVFGEVALSRWLPAVGARVVGIGAQGFLKHAHDGPGLRPVVPARWRADPALLARVDVVCLSEEDAADDGELLEWLRRHVRIVALTLGERGSILWSDQGRVDVGVHACTAVDPTGAGDAYAAALLHGIARGLPLHEAARLGAAVASAVVERMGTHGADRAQAAVVRALGIPVAVHPRTPVTLGAGSSVERRSRTERTN